MSEFFDHVMYVLSLIFAGLSLLACCGLLYILWKVVVEVFQHLAQLYPTPVWKLHNDPAIQQALKARMRK